MSRMLDHILVLLNEMLFGYWIETFVRFVRLFEKQHCWIVEVFEMLMQIVLVDDFVLVCWYVVGGDDD